MKSVSCLLAELMSIAVVTVLLLSVGVEPASAAGFPKPSPCRPGFVSPGFGAAPRLCIDQFEQSATDFDTAMLRCRNRLAYVASYGDLYYILKTITFPPRNLYNPNGKWIGPDLVGDNQALIGNRDIQFIFDPAVEDFESIGSKFDVRSYWCAHDVE
jgi:hypothetical protein